MKEKAPISVNAFTSYLRTNSHIRNCIVETDKPVILTNNVVTSEISNCAVKKLTLKGSRFSSKRIEIKDCVIGEIELIDFGGEEFHITGGEIDKISIRSQDVTHCELSALHLSMIKSHLEVKIEGLNVSGEFRITDCPNINSVGTHRCSFNHVHFGKSFMDSITFGACQLMGKMTLVNLGATNLIVKMLTVQQYFHVISVTIKNKFYCENGRFNSSLLFSNDNNINTFEIKDTSIHALTINGGNFNSFIVRTDSLGTLQTFTTEKEQKIVFNEQFVYDKQDKNSTHPVVKIKDISCGRLILDNFYNKNLFELVDSEIYKELSLVNCNLKPSDQQRALFKNVDFFDCKKLTIFHTQLLGANFFLVRWNSNYRLNKLEDELKGKSPKERLNHYWGIKESYRQLKILSMDNFNKIDANFFQRGELDTYYEILSVKTFKQGLRNGVKYIGDFLILWISKTFGGYGMNIWTPIVWWLIFHTILFTVILDRANLPFYWAGWDFSQIDWVMTRTAITLYLNLLSPVHSTEFFGVSIFGITDFLIRVLAGFFIYYIIRASRKFIISL